MLGPLPLRGTFARHKTKITQVGSDAAGLSERPPNKAFAGLGMWFCQKPAKRPANILDRDYQGRVEIQSIKAAKC